MVLTINFEELPGVQGFDFEVFFGPCFKDFKPDLEVDILEDIHVSA